MGVGVVVVREECVGGYVWVCMCVRVLGGYEVRLSLVGSEMCIRDNHHLVAQARELLFQKFLETISQRHLPSVKGVDPGRLKKFRQPAIQQLRIFCGHVENFMSVSFIKLHPLSCPL